MFNKISSIIVVVSLFIAITIGIIFRQTYTNITAQPNPLENFSVALFDTDMGPENLMDIMRDELPDSNMIIRAKSFGEIDFRFKRNNQLIEVLEVYKGDELEVGDEIWVTASSWGLFFDDMTANLTFVNVMKPDQEYLIFLDEKVETMDDEEVVYSIPSFIIPPIFSYSDHDNKILNVSENNRYVPYKEVKDNEFFVSSKEALEGILSLKDEMLELYPRD